MPEATRIRVRIVLAEATAQPATVLVLPSGCTAWQAVEASGLLSKRRDLDPARLAVAVFGRLVGRDQCLEDGDRVEVLRPLPEDPKLRRRRAASAGRTLGRG